MKVLARQGKYFFRYYALTLTLSQREREISLLSPPRSH